MCYAKDDSLENDESLRLAHHAEGQKSARTFQTPEMTRLNFLTVSKIRSSLCPDLANVS